MFADDIALASDHVVELQRRLNSLHQFCQKSKLVVNIAKTIVVILQGAVVFRGKKNGL